MFVMQILQAWHLPTWLAIVGQVLVIGLGVVTLGKGKIGFALLGISLFPAWIVGAVRLAKPESWYARRYYDPPKLALGRRRFGAGESSTAPGTRSPDYRVLPFCPACTAETADQGAGRMFRMNGCGLGFYGWRDYCRDCGSSIRSHCISLLWVPVIPVGRYRVIYTSKDLVMGSQYFSRKVIGARPSTMPATVMAPAPPAEWTRPSATPKARTTRPRRPRTNG
jgi:hypothetical protein